MPLVTPTELGDLLGEPVDTARATAAIDVATGVVQGEARQHLDAVNADTVTVRPVDGVLHLPERPVRNVSSVVLPDGTALAANDYWFSSSGIVGRTDGQVFATTGTEHIRVTYDHGFVDVPGALRALVLRGAARAYSNPTGATNESVGAYNVGYGSGSLYSENELRVARLYRASPRTVPIATS